MTNNKIWRFCSKKIGSSFFKFKTQLLKFDENVLTISRVYSMQKHAFDDLKTAPVTLTKYIVAGQQGVKGATGEFSQLLSSIQSAIKSISNSIRRAGIVQLHGLEGKENIHGEKRQKLDVVANELFVASGKESYSTCLIASEELDEILFIEPEKQGKYIFCFDPLDGSSNINCLAPIGSIFSILERGKGELSEKDVLQPGNRIIAAGYALYASSTILMLCLGKGKGVQGFILDCDVGEFLLSSENIRVPSKGNIYSVNEGNFEQWEAPVQEFVNRKKDPKFGTPYSFAYIGSMVGDIHRTLLTGGIFMYPGSKKAPGGKLRLLYECNPMAFLMTESGGLATNGKSDILDIVPKKVHEKSPIFMGSRQEVEELIQLYNSSSK